MMTCLEMMMSIAKDHLTDADMLIGYAKECHYQLDYEGFHLFRKMANGRLEDFESIQHEINIMIRDNESEKTPQECITLWECSQSLYLGWTDKMESALHRMSKLKTD